MIKLLKRLNQDFNELPETHQVAHVCIPLIIIILATLQYNWNASVGIFILQFMCFRLVGGINAK